MDKNKDKTTVDDIIGIVHTDEPTDSVEEVCKLRGRENRTEKRFTVQRIYKGMDNGVKYYDWCVMKDDTVILRLTTRMDCKDVVEVLNKEYEELKSFKQRVFDLIDKTIEEETQIAENIEEVTQETRPYAKAVNRITIKTLENLKWELQE